MTTRRLAAVVASLTVAVALAGLLAGCSGSSGFPGVLDKPTPRADVPLSADQVKQATTDLISDRERLSSQTEGDTGAATTGSTAQASGKKNRSAAAGQPMSLDAAQASAGTDPKP